MEALMWIAAIAAMTGPAIAIALVGFTLWANSRLTNRIIDSQDKLIKDQNNIRERQAKADEEQVQALGDIRDWAKEIVHFTRDLRDVQVSQHRDVAELSGDVSRNQYELMNHIEPIERNTSTSAVLLAELSNQIGRIEISQQTLTGAVDSLLRRAETQSSTTEGLSDAIDRLCAEVGQQNILLRSATDQIKERLEQIARSETKTKQEPEQQPAA